MTGVITVEHCTIVVHYAEAVFSKYAPFAALLMQWLCTLVFLALLCRLAKNSLAAQDAKQHV